MREAIYKYFDSNGIKIIAERLFILNRDLEFTTKNQLVYQPTDYPFNFTAEEMSEYFVDYIRDTTSVDIGSINNIDSFMAMNKMPFIVKAYNSNKNYHCLSLAFGKIHGGMTLHGSHGISSLGNIEEIDGDLVLSSTKLRSLGMLRKIYGSFWISQTEGPFTWLESLQNLEYVEGDVNLKQSAIKYLGALSFVGGNLNLRKTEISTLSNVKVIQGNLLINKKLKGAIDLSSVLIRGKVKYYND